MRVNLYQFLQLLSKIRAAVDWLYGPILPVSFWELVLGMEKNKKTLILPQSAMRNRIWPNLLEMFDLLYPWCHVILQANLCYQFRLQSCLTERNWWNFDRISLCNFHLEVSLIAKSSGLHKEFTKFGGFFFYIGGQSKTSARCFDRKEM